MHRICSFVDETITFEVFVFIYCQILYKSTVTVAQWVKPVDPKTKGAGFDYNHESIFAKAESKSSNML